MSGGRLERLDRPEAKLLLAEFKKRQLDFYDACKVIGYNETNTRKYLKAMHAAKLIRVCDWIRTVGNFRPVYGYNPNGLLPDKPRPSRLTGAEYSRRWHEKRNNEIKRFKACGQFVPTLWREVNTVWATRDGKNPIGEHGTATCINRNRTGFVKHAW